MSEFSQSRLESKIALAISTLIVQGEIKNHNLSTLVSVSRVELSPDNSQAKIFISYLDDSSKFDNSVLALNQASGFIQKRLSKFLNTKKTPVLTFIKDTSYLEGESVNRLIDSVLKEDGTTI